LKKSEDTSLLKNEIDKGQKYLMQLAALRDECANLSVSKNSRSVFFLREFSYLKHSRPYLKGGMRNFDAEIPQNF
jgi:hypothetical protein